MRTKSEIRHAWLGALALGLMIFCSLPAPAQADLPFQQPPKEILELADIEMPPRVLIDGNARFMVLLNRPMYKTLAELAQPELRLAGLRINPRNHDASRPTYFTGITLQELQSGRKIPVAGLPQGALRIEYPSFSPRGTYFSFILASADRLELWLLELASGKARRQTDARLSGVLGSPYVWSPDEQSLYCRMRDSLAPFVDDRPLPTGPAVQEAGGVRAPVRTYQDLLRNKTDEERFERFAKCRVDRVSLEGRVEPFLPAGIYGFKPAPGSEYVLVHEIHGPYSYLHPFSLFPYRMTVVDRSGKKIAELVDKPLRDKVPIDFDAVEEGKRRFAWRDDKPATIVYCVAEDGGDPSKPAEFRDTLYQLEAPFTGEPRRLACTRNRFTGIVWGDARTAVLSDFWYKSRNTKTYLVDPGRDNPAPVAIFDLSSEDLYRQPGDFATAPDAAGCERLLFDASRRKLYLSGEGYGPKGNRPFLDEFDIATGKTRRLWQADGLQTYETIVRVLDIRKGALLTRIESPTRFPNYAVRRIGGAAKPVTAFANPYRSLQGMFQKMIQYKRGDGVDLKGTLYLPAGYDAKRDGRLPMLMEAYPIEFKDKAAAGMVDDSPHRFAYLSWGSPVFWVARGYAVLEGAQFPIVGQGKEEPNDTYIEQLVQNAKAAIDAVDKMGVVDPRRVAVMGHSYGAFMTANLLAHCDLFAAGIARSGAYNRTLTPFGFQAEERNYWQAQTVYLRMSPFNYADKLKEPILLIHGDADNNPGTFTLQSERLFQALKGTGGIARLVLLPHESHGYAARENILHMLWEMDSWLEKWVKNRKP